MVKGRTGAQLHQSARGCDLGCSSQWDILEDPGREQAVQPEQSCNSHRQKTALLNPKGLCCPLSSTQTKPKGRGVRGQTRRGREAGPEQCLALAHFPARRSSWRLVRMYLKNSYTDQAIAVEGI